MVEKPARTRRKTKTTKAAAEPSKPERYFEAVGRRKESIARVRLYTKKAGITVNKIGRAHV